MKNEQQNIPTTEKQPKYLNLLTDFGFKKIFVSKYASVEAACKGIEVVRVGDVPSLVRGLFAAES